VTRDILAVPPVPADERIAYGDDPNQFFDFWRPVGAVPWGAVVMIHGGFWRARYDLTHTSPLCAVLANRGLEVANLEYRRVGDPGGGWPNTFLDVLAGFNAACNTFSDPSKVVVLGHSAGGHLALRLACDIDAMWGVLALAPVACLDLAYKMGLSNGAVAEFLGGTPEDLPATYETACPSRQESSVRRVILQGSADEIVPSALTDCYVDRQLSKPGTVTVVEVPGANHFDLIDPESKVWPTLLECLHELLKN